MSSTPPGQSHLSPKKLTINQPPEYEYKLLAALACFLNRPIETQATAALSMYLRQGHDRIMPQVRYYAHKAGMSEYELLDKIVENPQWVYDTIIQGQPIHPTDEPDVFSD
ncbi:MAG: hypothetical protein F6K09_01685 [Merismopedia sp. SIO2A8]|nr:hypothetical protein [Merismopedia sp. SIO2A8]